MPIYGRPLPKARFDPALHRLDRVAHVVPKDLPIFIVEVVEQWRSYEPSERLSQANALYLSL